MSNSEFKLPRLWTIGHSSRTLPELLALLQAHAIAGVVDVRRVPRSRRHPHFGRERLAAALAAVGIRYDHREGLGGMRVPDGTPANAGLEVAAFRGYADYRRLRRSRTSWRSCSAWRANGAPPSCARRRCPRNAIVR